MNVTLSAYCGQCGSGVTSLNYGPLKGPKPAERGGFCACCGNSIILRRPEHGVSPKTASAPPSQCEPQVPVLNCQAQFEPEQFRQMADELESVGMEDNEYVRDEVVSMLRCAETQARELAALRTKVREFQAAARKVRVGDSPEVWALVQGVDALLAPPIPPLSAEDQR